MSNNKKEYIGPFVLVINCGSSSLKWSLFHIQTEKHILKGLVEALGSENAQFHITDQSHIPAEKYTIDLTLDSNHKTAIHMIKDALQQRSIKPSDIAGIGHRVVHGGEKFTTSTVINETTKQHIQACSALAPLHNPANLLGIEQAEQYFPGVKQVAVFDTSFHQTMPASSYLYAIPQEYYKHYQVRRYGFHGTSHDYVSKKAALLLDQDIYHTNLITLHLGNGCSACAILNGQSVNTTMGLTPLEGLIMGTRSGNIDPGVFEYLHSQANLSIEEISTILNKQSGLLGISGFSNDMRALEQKAQSLDSNSQLAITMFCERLAGEIARLHIHLPRLDALVFTGGIGENSMLIREEVVKLLGFLNLKIENKANQDHGRYSSYRINEPDTLPILVIPTDEEQKIALEVVSKGAN